MSVEFPPIIPPPPWQRPAPNQHPGHPPPAQTPEQHAAQDAYVAALKNGVRPDDPPPKPFPGDAGYTAKPGEHKEAFRCEGGVFYGYKHACIDWQRLRDGEKWEKKLSAWSAHYFDPGNIAMTHEDWTTLCKIAATVVTFTGCLAVIASCGTADTMTFGTLTVPCVLLTGVICGGHAGATQGLLFDRCGILMGAR